MTTIQPVNNNTISVPAVDENNVSANILNAKNNLSPDEFIKKAIKEQDKMYTDNINFLTETLKTIKKGGIESLSDNTKQQLSGLMNEVNVENIKNTLCNHIALRNTINNGATFDKAINKLTKNSNTDEVIAILKLREWRDDAVKFNNSIIESLKKSFIDNPMKYFENNSFIDNLHLTDELQNNNTVQETVEKNIRKTPIAKYAAIGTIALGTLYLLISNFLSNDKKQNNK